MLNFILGASLTLNVCLFIAWAIEYIDKEDDA